MSMPQIIVIVLLAMDLGINLAKHKEPKEGSSAEYNFWTACIVTIIWGVVLWLGGFWR